MRTSREEIVMASRTTSPSHNSHNSVEGEGQPPAEKVAPEHDEESQAAAAPAPGGGPPQGPMYTHGFWDKELAPMRKEYIIGMLRVTVLITVLIWGIVTM